MARRAIPSGCPDGRCARRRSRPRIPHRERTRRSRRRDRPNSRACSRRGCRSVTGSAEAPRGRSTTLRVACRLHCRARRPDGAAGVLAPACDESGRYRPPAPICASPFAMAAITCGGGIREREPERQLLLGGELPREFDVESRQRAVRAGKVERGPRPDQDDELARPPPARARVRDRARAATARCPPRRQAPPGAGGCGAKVQFRRKGRWRRRHGEREGSRL